MKRLFTMLIVLSMAFTMAWAQNDLNLTFEDDTDVANWGNYDQANQWSTKTFDATAGVDGSGAIVFGDAGYGLLMKRPITATLGAAYSLTVDVKVEGWSAPYELYLTVDGLGSAPDSVTLDTTGAGWLTYTVHGFADTATAGYIKFEGGNDFIQSYVTIDNLIFDDDAQYPFFSEYMEGGYSNKAIEIYNPGDFTVDLSNYGLMNGDGSGGYYSADRMAGSIAPGSVYTIVNPDFDFSLIDSASVVDSLWGAYATYFNGDDARFLVHLVSGTWDSTDAVFDTLDAIGDPLDTGYSAWDVAGVVGASKDHTMIRKSTVTSGNMDWAASAGTNVDDSEWQIYEKDFAAGLGYHPSVFHAVTFSVDMSMQLDLGAFNPDSGDVVDVAGSMNGWSGSAAFEDPDSNLIYTGTFPVAPGDIQYKFRINGSNWESISGNRTATITGDAVLDTVWFNDVEWTPTTPVEVFIQADMTVQLLSGNFDPDNDLIVVRGDHDNFGNWGGAVAMTLDPEQTNIYTLLSSFNNAPIGSPIGYKFVILTGGNVDAAIWESSPNRSFTAIGDEEDTDGNGYGEILQPVAYFADVTPDDIITQDVTVHWTVDISSAYHALDAGDTLIDAQTGADDITAWDQVNGVSINGVLSQWWDWGNDLTCVGEWAMESTDDEYIYTFSYLFTAGQSKMQQYKYGINSLDNEAGFGENRVFTIDDTEAIYTIPQDCFGSQNTDDTMVFPVDCGTVSIEHLSSLPRAYNLSQNYPNPFNPTTTINFALPEASNVVLTIYNALGQRVRTLKTDNLNAGNYSVTWDGLDNTGNMIPSGIYIYTMTAGKHSFSKKMLMLK